MSGTFYSIEKLPLVIKEMSLYNPFFYMIDGMRYSMIGISDGPIKIGIIYLLSLNLIFWFIAYFLYKKGYKIKT